MLLLRQLAATGITMLLLPRWHCRHPAALCCPSPGAASAAGNTPSSGAADAATGMDTDAAGDEAQQAQQAQQQVDPAAVAAAAEALRAAVLADPGAFAQALFQQLAHGHPLLGAEGQQRSVR